MDQGGNNGSRSAGEGVQQGFLSSTPRYAQPGPEQQLTHQPYDQQQLQHGSSDEKTVHVWQQQQQQQQQEATLPQPAAQQQAASIQPWQYQPPPSNVVEIDQVQVTPIDDPFYDPSNPSGNYDRSSRDWETSMAAALSDDTSTAGVPHPSTNAVEFDDVDYEGFAAPLLEPETGECNMCSNVKLRQALR
jgi:hypothetical protein